MLSEDERGRLIRNLKLSIQTVSACGHALRVTVADMLGDFDDLHAASASDNEVKRLCEMLDRAIKENRDQNRQVFEVLGCR